MTDPADVPSPIDFRTVAEAQAWAAAAMIKRPWREEFFRRMVDELAPLRAARGAILELGSGPGFLAQRMLERLPSAEYTALDFSPAMHALAKERLKGFADRVRFIEADFKTTHWTTGLPRYDAVVTVQAVHELRHKRHATGLYRAVNALLPPGGVFLMCDHIRGDAGMDDPALYMTLAEHEHALVEGGFNAVHEVHRESGQVLYRAHRDAP